MLQNLRFDINPHVVKQLGEELVTDEITALMELVKNAYDADATYVSVEIDTTNKYSNPSLFYPDHKGYILVEDDGDGMDLQVIRNAWLIISTSSKRNLKLLKAKTAKGRAPLGEKGLGRLSTQRLAKCCEIFTARENKNQIHIAFNWEDFEKNIKLSEIPIDYKELDSKRKGTTLILSNIKDAEVWKGKNLETFKGQISQMISPYQDNKPFEVFLKVNGESIDLLEENVALRDIALSCFSFHLKNDLLFITGKIRPEKLIGQRKDEYFQFIEPDRGRKFQDFLQLKKNDFNLQRMEEGSFFLSFSKQFELHSDLSKLEITDGGIAHPGNFTGEIHEFSFDRWVNSEEKFQSAFSSFSNYREFAEQQIGIKIYRNGFAVKPFGLDGNDWLRLREAQTTGTSYYYLRPSNVIGYIAIDEYENGNLKDKTDREGLVSNPYSRNFESMAFFIRDECNRFLNFVRRNYNEFILEHSTKNRKIQTISQSFNALQQPIDKAKLVKDNAKVAKVSIATTRKEIQQEANRIKRSPLFSNETEKKYAEYFAKMSLQLENAEISLNEILPIIEQVEVLDEAITVLKSKIEILDEQLNNFSELAGLGLTAETVSHEFKNISDQLAEKSSFYSKKLENNTLSNSDMYVFFEYITSTIKGLRVQLKHLDPALKYVRDKKENFLVSSFFKSQEDFFQNRFERQNIEFDLIITDDFEVEMNRGVFTQVTDNIILNSEYWLNDRKRNEPEFKPQISIVIQKPWVDIFDNGFGVSKNVQESLFEPFVTLKPKSTGRGLGLFIVQQLLDSIGCTISLAPDLNENKRRYKFTINLSNVIKK
ncbi:sensor histidine kinase [Sunxiuqinia dokdonensis]|uniref:histidine kinase n=1 Tax=Sunxiuqinia dokdonensis TaxID=1409788 RepID=A0A0L8V6N4_9BACT|nr:sensor histidine kinase [Sunxiuqinia dokdonensis]KOH44104.1 histidine Kinase [Sunxiuqinia dokdonensis]